MQELIEWLNDYPTNVPTIHKSAVISKAESLLEKEKEQMIDFTMDFMCEDNSYESYRRASALDLFNKTFNNNG